MQNIQENLTRKKKILEQYTPNCRRKPKSKLNKKFFPYNKTLQTI